MRDATARATVNCVIEAGWAARFGLDAPYAASLGIYTTQGATGSVFRRLIATVAHPWGSREKRRAAANHSRKPIYWAAEESEMTPVRVSCNRPRQRRKPIGGLSGKCAQGTTCGTVRCTVRRSLHHTFAATDMPTSLRGAGRW